MPLFYLRRSMEELSPATTPSQRLEVILRISGYNTVTELAQAIKLKDTRYLTLVQGGKMDFSLNIARSLHRLYPLFTVPWIMQGEHLLAEHIYGRRGQILLTDYEMKKVWLYKYLYTPFYSNQNPEQALYYPAKLCKEATFAYRYPATCLEPYCHTGDILLMKEIQGPVTQEGLYYIETPTKMLFRYLRREPEGEKFSAAGFNDRIEDLTVEQRDIRICGQVCGVIAAPCRFPLEPLVP